MADDDYLIDEPLPRLPIRSFKIMATITSVKDCRTGECVEYPITIICTECGDGKFNIAWFVVEGLIYPMNISYHRADNGDVLCGSCHIVLREVERKS